MASNTDPAKALGYAFSHVAELDPHHLAAALNLSAVTAERTGKEYPPIQIHVPPREIGVGQPTIAQIVARKIAALHPAGTPHGDEFIKSNQDLL